MISRRTYNNITWIDLENPLQDEVRELVEEFSLHPIIGQELLSPTLRPKVDVYNNAIYLILHFPTTDFSKHRRGKLDEDQEIDFIIGKDFIITTRYAEIDAMHDFSKIFEVNSIIDRTDMGEHAGYIFFYMIQTMYRTLMNKVEGIRDLLMDVEEEIFAGNEKHMVVELSKINRMLLNFRESTLLHREILESFEIAGKDFFGKDFTYHLRSILGEYHKIKSALQGNTDYLHELRDTNDSLLSSKQNEIMKTLTVTTFIILPLSLIAGIFGMNTKNMPFVGEPNDFLMVLALMIIFVLMMFVFFKHKKWL